MNSLSATLVRYLLFTALFFISVPAQNQGNGPIWKEISKNKFNTTFYDLAMLVAAKGEIFDVAVKTDYNSEQVMPGLEKRYFSEMVVYTVHLREAKYLIKTASYFDGKGALIKQFTYFTDAKADPSQMLPVTKGTHVYDLIAIHRLIHGKN